MMNLTIALAIIVVLVLLTVFLYGREGLLAYNSASAVNGYLAVKNYLPTAKDLFSYTWKYDEFGSYLNFDNTPTGVIVTNWTPAKRPLAYGPSWSQWRSEIVETPVSIAFTLPYGELAPIRFMYGKLSFIPFPYRYNQLVVNVTPIKRVKTPSARDVYAVQS